MSEEQERVAEELRRVREAARERNPSRRDSHDVLPSPRPPREPEPVPSEPVSAAPPPPPPPDAAAVNALWRAEPGGPGGLLYRLLRRLLAPAFEAQRAFNSRQVQLDNEVLGYIDARFAATHRHYDHVLGVTGRHLGEIDERHLILQEELVAHVHDLVKRIDLVLGEGERARLGLESALREVRSRLARLEQRLPPG